MGVFTPVALNDGYKIVGKDGMVSSVGNPDEVTPVFSIAKLASLQKVTD